MRPANLAVAGAGAVVGGLAAHGNGLALPEGTWVWLGLAAISTALVTAGGNVLNDFRDRDGDRINHPDRPLVTGEVSIRAAEGMTFGFFVAGIAVAIPVALAEPLVGLILAIAVVSLLAYEFRWKARGFSGNLLVSLLTALVFPYGGAAAGNALPVLPLAAMAFLATLSREVIKDMEDVAGDLDRRTLPQRLGLPFSSTLARLVVVAAIALSGVPLFWFVVLDSATGLAYAGLVGVADAIFVLSVLYLPERLRFEQSASKAAMAVALAAFLAVAFR
jgi:geranylgeranylglycerol-phosphate geranylgeranyltransferase